MSSDFIAHHRGPSRRWIADDDLWNSYVAFRASSHPDDALMWPPATARTGTQTVAAPILFVELGMRTLPGRVASGSGVPELLPTLGEREAVPREACARCQLPAPDAASALYEVWEAHRETFDVGNGVGDLVCSQCLTDHESLAIAFELLAGRDAVDDAWSQAGLVERHGS
jgi:hypothetical protein